MIIAFYAGTKEKPHGSRCRAVSLEIVSVKGIIDLFSYVFFLIYMLSFSS